MRDVFKLNETMMAELEAERQGARTVALAELEMMIGAFTSILKRRSGQDLPDATEAAMRTAKPIELGHRGRASKQLVRATGRFLMALWQGSELIALRECTDLVEQLMEHHLASAQAEDRGRAKGKRQKRARKGKRGW